MLCGRVKLVSAHNTCYDDDDDDDAQIGCIK